MARAQLAEVDRPAFLQLARVEGMPGPAAAGAGAGDGDAESDPADDPAWFAEAHGVERHFEVGLSDPGATPAELFPGGAAVPVTHRNRRAWARLAARARLRESRAQLWALRRGLASVVPVELLHLFTPREVEELFCGRATLDVALLRKCTEYEGRGLDGVTDAILPRYLRDFWAILEGFNHDERTRFLRFVCARSRLPPPTDFTVNFKVQEFPLPDGKRADDYLPTSRTCFFSLKLPRYSTSAVMRAKLLAAMQCTLMDADVRGEVEGWEE